MIKFTLLTKTILGYFDRQTFNVSIDFDFKYCVDHNCHPLTENVAPILTSFSMQISEPE